MASLRSFDAAPFTLQRLAEVLQVRLFVDTRSLVFEARRYPRLLGEVLFGGWGMQGVGFLLILHAKLFAF